MNEDQQDLYCKDRTMSTTQIMLTIYSVKLEIKFPCRMSLQFKGHAISSEVESKENIFTFHQDVKVDFHDEKQIQINALLKTEKGGSILAGVISYPVANLISKEGQKVVIGLRKCIDSKSVAEIKVNHVWIQQKERNKNLARSSIGGNIYNDPTLSPIRKVNPYEPHNKNFESKSQFGRNFIRKTLPPNIQNNNIHLPQRNNYLTPKANNKNQSYAAPRINIRDEHGHDFDKLDESFNDTRSMNRKAKKRRSQEKEMKKITDQTEHNLKLDVMKYKIKNEELEKTVQEKNKSIKDLKNQIVEFERKNIEKSYMQEELNAKENNQKILEDRISAMNSENINLRETIADQMRAIGELKESIRFEIIKNKEEFNEKANQLKHQFSLQKNKNNELEMEIKNKSQALIQAKKYIEDLENAAQVKIFEHDNLIQELKKHHAHDLRLISTRNEENENKIAQLLQQIQQKSQQINKMNEIISKMEHNDRTVQSHLQELEIEKVTLISTKNQHSILSKKCSKLEETLSENEKSFKKSLQMKIKEISEIKDSSEKNMKNIESKLTASYEKNKEMKQRNQDLENILNVSQNQVKKLKKVIEVSERNISELSNKVSEHIREIKSHEAKVASLEKQLQSRGHSSSHMQIIYKNELEHSKQSIENLNIQLEHTATKLISTKQSLEREKNEKSKLENKINLLEENQNRVNSYLKEKKEQFEAKQQELKNLLKNSNENVKKLEEFVKNKEKEINGWEIRQLNANNIRQRLEKKVEELEAKAEKLQKVTVPKLCQQKEKLSNQLEQTHSKLIDSLQQNKYITNERKKLQSQSQKNIKITDVLNEDKLSLLNELNKLKNTIKRMQKNEEKLNKDLTNHKEEIVRLNKKIEILEKQNIQSKETLNNTLSFVLSLKKNFGTPKKNGIKNYNEESPVVKLHQSKEKRVLRKKETMIDSLTNSRVMNSSFYDVKQISDIIQNSSKQQQSTIESLEMSLDQHKNTIVNLENELSTQSFMAKNMEQKMQDAIDQLHFNLEQANNRIYELSNTYEDRVSKLGSELSRREKDLNQSKNTISSLKYEIDMMKKRMSAMSQDFEDNVGKDSQRIQQLQGEIEYYLQSIKSLETSKKQYETKLQQLQDSLETLESDYQIKQKQQSIFSKKLAALILENNQNQKYRKQYYESILSLEEELSSKKDENAKIKQLLKSDEESKKKMQDFINELLKQKQGAVKIQLHDNGRINELDGCVMELRSRCDMLEEGIQQRQGTIGQLKLAVKNNTVDIKNLEKEIEEMREKNHHANLKIEQKNKLISEKEREIELTNQNYRESMAKHKEEHSKLSQNFQSQKATLEHSITQKQLHIQTLQNDQNTLTHNLQKLSLELTQKQEQIFFSRQKISLSESMINEMKKESSEGHLMISQLEGEVRSLSMEIGNKEQLLYEYSGKIYQLEQRLQEKEVQIQAREEKIDYDWQCRYEEACEEYQNRMQIMQKEKRYQKQKSELLESQKSSTLAQKSQLIEELEKQIAALKLKTREIEEQKMQNLNQKNKDMEKYKNQVTNYEKQVKNMEIQVKKKTNQINNKEESIKKLEKKIMEHDRDLGEVKGRYEKEIEGFKKNQSVFRGYKEEIKNNQWVVEREAKKLVQIFIQKVINCCPEAKDKLIEPIRILEQTMSNTINFKV